jgi:hypothetical protein
VRDSVFSWRHLGAQLWGTVLALLRRLRRRRSTRQSLEAAQIPAVDRASHETVRDAYRRMLLAARAAGRGRDLAETTRELEGRLVRGPVASQAGALADLTAVYDAVRYGEVAPQERDRVRAVAQANAVSSVLQEAVSEELADPTSDAADPPSEARSAPPR